MQAETIVQVPHQSCAFLGARLLVFDLAQARETRLQALRLLVDLRLQRNRCCRRLPDHLYPASVRMSAMGLKTVATLAAPNARACPAEDGTRPAGDQFN
jgi:hypothetical protein